MLEYIIIAYSEKKVFIHSNPHEGLYAFSSKH